MFCGKIPSFKAMSTDAKKKGFHVFDDIAVIRIVLVVHDDNRHLVFSRYGRNIGVVTKTQISLRI